MFNDRKCMKTYETEGESGRKIKLEKGDDIFIPVVAIHRDPEYYPEPDRFDPERFSDERKGSIQAGTYLPFGSGPRNCIGKCVLIISNGKTIILFKLFKIGSRFALMECKAFLYHLLTTFTFEPAPNSIIPLRLEKSGFTLMAEKGFNVILKPRF